MESSLIADTDLERCQQIIAAVCKALEVEEADLKTTAKPNVNAEARQILFKLLRNEGLKLKVIANMFNRDHSTVMYNIETYQEKVDAKDKLFSFKLHAVKKELEGICELA